MSRKRVGQQLRIILTLLIAAGLIGTLLFMFWPHQENKSGTDRLKQQSQVIHENGKTVIVLAPILQKKVGIVIQPIRSDSGKAATQTAYGSVMILPDVSDLLSRLAVAKADLIRAKANSVSARAAYQKAQAARQSAQAALQKVQVNLDISHRSYERLRTLNADNRNVSAKTVESAEGTYQGTQSDIQAAKAQIQSAQADMLAAQGQLMVHQADQQAAQGSMISIQEAALQRLGPVISRWMLSGNPQFNRLLQRQDVLVQVTMPPVQSPPSVLSLHTADQADLQARYVAPAIQVDPKVQGAGFIYLASSAQGMLLSGMNVVASLPGKASGEAHQFAIPSSAVVWLEGSPWVYVQVQSNRFIRKPVSGKQAQEYWMASGGFNPGERVVTQGAQLLLSQEFQSQYQGE
jgi:hypothetical protein